jgi:hypothetical protein
MKSFRPDPFFHQLGRDVLRTTAALADARRSGFGLQLAEAAHDRARRAFDGYRSAAATLSEAERAYAIAHRLPVPSIVAARLRLEPRRYRAALASNAPLLPSDPLPGAVQDEADTIAAAQDLRNEIAAAIRVGKFDKTLVAKLAKAVEPIAAARGEDPDAAAAYTDDLQRAYDARDPTAAREALEKLAAHYGLEITAPAPRTLSRTARGLVLGVDCGLTERIAR